MNKAVFDTNVVVSGFLSPHGPPGRIVEWLREGIVQAVLDDRIFDEYAAVLNRPAFGLTAEDVALVLDAIRRRGVWVKAPTDEAAAGLPDPDDAPFLECARTADVALVTGYPRHDPKSSARLEVMAPAEHVKRIEQLGTRYAAIQNEHVQEADALPAGGETPDLGLSDRPVPVGTLVGREAQAVRIRGSH